jgi:glycosyltransferase involved in cell wall biosynthesis
VREGWGLVVLEANAVGTPAVGYDVAGLRDSIRDGRTGVLATPGDATALGHAAADLVLDGDRLAAFSDEARTWAAQFSWDETADRLLSVVVESIQARRLEESIDSCSVVFS